VRTARVEDWPAVASLLAELGRPDVRGQADECEHRARFERYLQREDAFALVAQRKNRVAGFVNLEVRPRLNHATPDGWIPELIVADGERGSGIGSLLLHRAEHLARERGCSSIMLESANWRRDAHRFYLREGWKDAAKSFYKALE
jgi:(aminoalkyl)phosphonate N-acetyltransferase